MDNHITHGPQLIDYETFYLSSIRPKLEAIDIFLKENIAPFNVYEVARILEIDITEVDTLMQNLNVTHLDTTSFFAIVLHASSDICQLLSRKWRYTNVETYTPEIVAEIFNLNIHKVKLAFADLGISEITDMEFSDIFKRIHFTIF